MPPPDPTLEKLFRFLNLEKGLIFGLALLLLGLIASISAVGTWSARLYGPLDPTLTLRIVIPAFVSLSLGCQIILSSFFLSILGMTRK